MTDRLRTGAGRMRWFGRTSATGGTAVLSLMFSVVAASAFPSHAPLLYPAQSVNRVGYISGMPNAAAPPQRSQPKPQTPPVPGIGGTAYPPGRGGPTIGGPSPKSGIIGGPTVKKRF